jgi:hypothetical protein
LIGFFAVVAAYFAYRLRFLQQPTYDEAKFSEWAEFCLAFATAFWSAALLSGRSRAVPAGTRLPRR